MIVARFLCLATMSMFALSGVAQTCTTPIPIVASGTVSGTTCSGTTQLPSLVNGAMTGGQQIVYRATFATGLFPYVDLSLQPDAGVDMSLFVCPNACSSTASCIAAVDDNGAGIAEIASIPNPAGDYYIIVQAAPGSGPVCGGYSLTLSTPL